MEMYSELENDAGDTYLGDTTTGIIWEKYEEPHQNM